MVLPLHQLHAQIIRARNRERVFRVRINPFDTLNDSEFLSHYWFSKPNAYQVIELFRIPLERDTKRCNALSAQQQLLTTLHYLGTNSVQRDDARIAGMKQPTVCATIHTVIESIANRMDEFIVFPTGHQAANAEAQFAAKAVEMHIDPMPGVISALDGCHIRLENAPSHQNKAMFFNRKGFYSINAQFACDATLRCTNVVAKWYGSAHDSRVFQNSRLCGRFETGECRGMLLADSAYPHNNFILKPLRNAVTNGEKRYNKSQVQLRTVIEKFNGVLKNRFRCLKGLRVHLHHTEPIIVTCAILHNISIMLKEADPLTIQKMKMYPMMKMMSNLTCPWFTANNILETILRSN